MSADALIGLDWGTTSCRAYLIGAEGVVLARVSDGPGILRVESGAFGAALTVRYTDAVIESCRGRNGNSSTRMPNRIASPVA